MRFPWQTSLCVIPKNFSETLAICDAVFRSFAPCQVLTDFSENELRLGFYARDRNDPITAQSIPNCSSGPGVAHSAGALFLSSAPFLLEPRDGRAQFGMDCAVIGSFRSRAQNPSRSSFSEKSVRT